MGSKEDWIKKYAYFLLQRQHKHIVRERKGPDIHRAASIGILYNATEKEGFNAIRDFFRDLKDLKKKPHSLGYIDFDTVTFHPLARPEADYFFKNQLNWHQKPSGLAISNFIETPFDILINLSVSDFFPFDYITAHSKAAFKVGRYSPRAASFFDMTIRLENDAMESTFAYLIIHYLSKLNKQKHAELEV